MTIEYRKPHRNIVTIGIHNIDILFRLSIDQAQKTTIILTT